MDKVTRQDLVWLASLNTEREFSQRRVQVATKPKRVWTLYPHVYECDRPELPYVPRHNHNAFLEDYVHDWDYRGGSLVYYSRVLGPNDGVWLLLEY